MRCLQPQTTDRPRERRRGLHQAPSNPRRSSSEGPLRVPQVYTENGGQMTTSEIPIYDDVRAELGDPFDANSETSVALRVASEKAREELEALKELVGEPTEIPGVPGS